MWSDHWLLICVFFAQTHLLAAFQDEYPPEIIVLLSSKISNDAPIRTRLRPFFCDRIITVDHIPINQHHNGGDNGSGGSHVQMWDENCGWTKLRLFELESYDTILYVDADCLVLQDVSHLLHVDTTASRQMSERKRLGLLAAAPDIFPPDKFNAGVMVIRPSKAVFDDMMSRLPQTSCNDSNISSNNGRKQCTSYDGGDTGFLNSYYSGWYRDMPSYSRLSFGYNAQRFMHHCTSEKQPKYWDEGIDQVRIIHFSSSPKPWETTLDVDGERGNSDNASKLLGGEEKEKIQQSVGSLESMWQATFEQSQQYYKKELKKAQKAVSRRPAPSAVAAKAKPPTKLSPHQMVQRRYKELRKKGFSTSQAMETACAECGMNQEVDPSRAVGQLFGL